MDNDLLLLLQALDNIDGNLENVSDNIGRRKGQPLCQRHVRNAISLVYFNESQVLRLGSVLDVMAWYESVVCKKRRRWTISYQSCRGRLLCRQA